MKKIILLSFAIFLVAGCSKTPEEKVEALYEDGVEQIADFQYAKADSSFAQIFEIDPASTLGLLGVTKAHEARLEYFDAIQKYLTILSLSTDHEDAFSGLYNGYKNLGFYDEALVAAVHYNKNWHANTHTKYILGEAYKNLGDLKRAETYFTQAVNSGYAHKNAAHYMLATVLYMRGLHDDANKEASLADADRTDDPIFYNAAATYFETVGLIDSAMGYNRKLFENNKTDIQSVYLSYMRALKNNYHADNRMIIQTLDKMQVPPIVTVGLHLFKALHVDNKSNIRKFGLEYLVGSPKTLSARMYDLYVVAKVSDKQTIEQAVQLVESEILKGMYSEEFGEFFQNIIIMHSARNNLSPQTISLLNDISGLYLNRKDYKFTLALTNFVIGLKDECANNLKNIEAGHQRDADWITGIADVWGNLGVRQYDKAEEYYQKAIALDNNYYPAFENYVKLFERIENYKKALSVFEMYPQFEQNQYTALQKTKFLFYNKKYDEGLKQFKQFYKYASGDILFVKELVSILKIARRTDDLKSILAMLDSTNPDVKLLMATIAIENKEFDKSFKLLDEVFAVEPNNLEVMILKAETLFRTGKTAEAFELFEKNLAVNKNDPHNLILYSKALAEKAEKDIDYQRASNMARTAVFQGYGAIHYLVNLADIYYMMGRYDLCRGDMGKAIRRDKVNPYPFFRYGMACLKSKDQKRWSAPGKENLNKAIDLGLTGKFLTEAKAALK